MSSEDYPAEDTEALFQRTEAILIRAFGHPEADARTMTTEYRATFCNPEWCAARALHPHGDELIHHEGAATLAGMVHFFIGLRKSQSLQDYILWRGEQQAARAV